MKQRIRRLLLWLWPRVRRIYARYGLELSLRDMRSAPGAHTAGRSGSPKTVFIGVPGAHVWVLTAAALGWTLFFAAAGKAQQGGQTSSVPPLTGSAAPTGNCGAGSMYVNTANGNLYDCNSGSWNLVTGGGGGSGTVTSFSSGNFSPLFNTSVATPTTTPALSFAAISQSQNLFFASPNGASGNPLFRAMVAADVPASANGCAMHQFTISLASGLTVTCAQPVAADIGSIPGTSGQLLYNNAGAIGAEDPIVSYAYVNLLNAAAATATQTSATTRVSTFSGYGTLYVTLASLAGTYTSCTVQLKNADSLGNLINNGSAIALTMSNGVATFGVTSATGLQTTAQIQAVYSCSAYGSAGTISVDYVPGVAVGIIGTPTVNANAGSGQFNVTCTAANCPMNVAQFGGTNVVTGTGTSGAGIPRVTVSNDSTVGLNAGSNLVGAVNEDRGGTALVADPCQANTKSYVSINQTANAQLVTGTASKKIYPCSIHVVTATAQNIALVEGTGTTCGTGTAGVTGFGGSTAATGWNFAANGGISYGDGSSALGAEGTAADNLCLFQSGTGQVSGGLSYVVQ